MIFCREITAISPVKTFVLLCIRDKVRSQSWDSSIQTLMSGTFGEARQWSWILGNELTER